MMASVQGDDLLTGPPVEVPAFSGPLDLLLPLIKENEASIYDIPIAAICDQFHEHLAAMQVLDLRLAGEFLWMAAWLLQLKSKTLLPTPVDGEEDPRAELVERLLEYRRVKELAAVLSEIHVVRRGVWESRVETRVGHEEVELDWEEVDLDLLARAYIHAMESFAASHPPPLQVLPLRFTVESKIRELYARVREDGMVALLRQVHACPNVEEVVTLIAASLELARLGAVHADQRRPFAEIYLRPGEQELDLDRLHPIEESNEY